MLVLSTGHLDLPDLLQIEEKVAVMRSTVAMLVFVGTDQMDWLTWVDQFKGRYKPIAKLAWARDCAYILFDRDGPREPTLEYYEW